MSNLNKDNTYSDQVNIEALKAVLKMINNDIKDVKKDERTTKEEKIHLIMVLSRQRANIVQTSAERYPQINWIDEVGEGRQASLTTIRGRRFKVSLLKLKSITKNLKT